MSRSTRVQFPLSFEISIQLFCFRVLFSFICFTVCPDVNSADITVTVCGSYSLSLLDFVYFSSSWSNESTHLSMLAYPLPSSFLDIYSLPMSSLGRYRHGTWSSICFFSWSICSNSSLVYFKNDAEYIFIQPLCYDQDVTQGQFFSGA